MPEFSSDIGATLRETRMRARIDIGEVEMRTKIRAKYLRAIENEEWDLLPGPVYVKSFLRTYGDYLGLDSRLLVDEYRRVYERPSDAHSRPLSAVKRERERERELAIRGRPGPALPPWLLVVVVLIVVAGGLYLLGKGNGKSAKPSTTASSLTAPTHTATTPAAHTHTHTTAARAAGPPQASLKFAATGTVWVCVEDKLGKKLIPGVEYATGKTASVHSTELLVNLGNANVNLTVNGKPYPLSGSATSIGLKITPTAVSTLTAKPTCG